MTTDLNDKTADHAKDRPDSPEVTESETLLRSLAEQKDLYLRLAADFENYKRRNRQEIETRGAAQRDALIVDLLPVIDNLHRALASSAPANAAQVYQGVEMTLKQLLHLLRQHGLESDEIVGQPFDPHRHEALSQGYDQKLPDQSVLSVLQRGYRLGEKVIRPANVVVNDLASPKPSRDGR
jgi:molecular chaperone GrpE